MPDIGTPENPEILDPSLPPRPPPFSARWILARQILRWLIAICLPAALLDTLAASAVYTGYYYGGILPWIVVLLVGFPALMMSLVALVSLIILGPAFVLTLTGKITHINPNDPRLARLVKFKPFGD